ncbi:MAG: tRNA (guanosine(37)-N1)-methyltransferase TrmD [Moorella humiferrea]|uniref:tRNA (guanine-N(1)-)-methyltransferase n=2 Tax=Neomoorella humiferrea TaxID=676965 RepID=A0A2T0AUJ4_9FIRM|nr:tRNA (guanosine(37)-N1)-methyltransferase TrmD [Moorella humiferrea]MBE3573022.1 tRNA (guanosine(37)-N1)-methyltransferase TrmD [Moorella humiferrea]PRR74187.1 tRNA (guanine-N(1)-)-methyltransferase [Moorella humiferrea]
MRVDVLTIFPEMFSSFLNTSIIKRAREQGRLHVNLVDIRDYARNKHRSVDDYPFGGGPGMVMMAEPIFLAVESLLPQEGAERPPVILMSPQGEVFNQELAAELSREKHLILICGHYEGVDERVRQFLVSREISIGDYVLTGGELPAMVVIDAVTRLLPGVLGDPVGALEDSFAMGLLEYPQYTRPRSFRGMEVPEVLLSGNHEKIRQWRRRQALERTWRRRPDLLAKLSLSPEDRRLLDEIIKNSRENSGKTY